jgi:hypothetical protein
LFGNFGLFADVGFGLFQFLFVSRRFCGLLNGRFFLQLGIIDFWLFGGFGFSSYN